MAERSPNWTTDELILALDLYLREGQLSKSNPRVVALSGVLNALPIHTTRPDLETFRNATGVALKLANFAALDPAQPGAGMQHGGRGDRDVWDRLHGEPTAVTRLAVAISSQLGQVEGVATPEPDEDGVPEGRLLYRRHRSRERNSAKVDQKKRSVLASGGTLACEACGFDFGRQYGADGKGYIECHHRVPLAESGETITKLRDLILLCANCHRVAHRARPWLSPEGLADLIRRAPYT